MKIGIMNDPLEVHGKLTSHDYDYLTGKWDKNTGAAFNIVAEWCKNHGYGTHGNPTEYGRRAIKVYEKSNV